VVRAHRYEPYVRIGSLATLPGYVHQGFLF
jgi:hypothetical protein